MQMLPQNNIQSTAAAINARLCRCRPRPIPPGATARTGKDSTSVSGRLYQLHYVLRKRRIVSM